MGWVMAVLIAAGIVISAKSMLEPGSRAKWFGKVVDVQQLTIQNDMLLLAKVLAALINGWELTVHTAILRLLNWVATPKKGHLPFLAGINSMLSYYRSAYIRVTPRLWISLVQAWERVNGKWDFAPLVYIQTDQNETVLRRPAMFPLPQMLQFLVLTL